MESAARRADPGATPTPSANGIPVGEPDFDPTATPIWEVFDQLLSALPAEERNKLPVDAAEKHDHYIHGLAK